MRGIYRGRMAALGALTAITLLAACGSDPQPSTSVVVVPPAQQAPATTTVVPAPGTTVLPPGARVVCADGRSPPCP